MSTANASIRRSAVSGRNVRANRARYGMEKRRCLVTRIASSGSPLSSCLPVTTAIGCTVGRFSFCSCRSSSYSRSATVRVISFIAYTSSPTCTKRTMWREMPRGRFTSSSGGQVASGFSHGSVNIFGSELAAVIFNVDGPGPGVAGSSAFTDVAFNARGSNCGLSVIPMPYPSLCHTVRYSDFRFLDYPHSAPDTRIICRRKRMRPNMRRTPCITGSFADHVNALPVRFRLFPRGCAG